MAPNSAPASNPAGRTSWHSSLRSEEATMTHRLATLIALVGTLLVACTPAGPRMESGQGSTSGDSARAAAPKRLTAAVQSDPGILNDWVNPPGAGVPGLDVLQTLVDSGLAIPDDRGAQVPLLSDAVPTLDNG